MTSYNNALNQTEYPDFLRSSGESKEPYSKTSKKSITGKKVTQLFTLSTEVTKPHRKSNYTPEEVKFVKDNFDFKGKVNQDTVHTFYPKFCEQYRDSGRSEESLKRKIFSMVHKVSEERKEQESILIQKSQEKRNRIITDRFGYSENSDQVEVEKKPGLTLHLRINQNFSKQKTSSFTSFKENILPQEPEKKRKRITTDNRFGYSENSDQVEVNKRSTLTLQLKIKQVFFEQNISSSISCKERSQKKTVSAPKSKLDENVEFVEYYNYSETETTETDDFSDNEEPDPFEEILPKKRDGPHSGFLQLSDSDSEQ